MKWFVLIVVISIILALGYWSYHQMDQVILITDYWKITENNEWGLVDFRGESPQLYNFESYNEFWPIFKGLWPVWTLFILIFLVLTPLSILIYNLLNDAQINFAKQCQKEAELAQFEVKAQANEQILNTDIEAKERVNSAYKEQKKRVRAELDSETQSLQQLKNALLQREETIREREIAAQKSQNKAEQQVLEIQRQYTDELQRFETEIEKLTKARDNAQSGYQRLKNKKKYL